MVVRVIFSKEKSQIFVNEESLENPEGRPTFAVLPWCPYRI